MWKTQYKHPKTCVSCSGSRIIADYVLAIDANGCQYLKECGKRNIYDFIQSHRESCDLKFILANLDKASVNGMVTSFKYSDLKDAGLVDLTAAPATLGDMINVCKHGEQLFNGLDHDIRKEFNFSVEKFVSSLGTQEFRSIMSKFAPAPSAASSAASAAEVPVKKIKKSKKKVEVDEEDE